MSGRLAYLFAYIVRFAKAIRQEKLDLYKGTRCGFVGACVNFC
jgi:hypothetical protein